HAYTQALLAQEKEIAIRLANDIDHFIAKKRDMLKLAGSAFFLQHMAHLEADFLLALLLKSDSEIRWVAILDTQGQELTRMSRTEAVLRDDLLDRSADTWFQAALHGTAVTSPVFFTTTNEPYLRCGKVDKSLSMVSLASRGGPAWIPSSCGRAMVTRSVRLSSWASLSTSRRRAKS